MKINNKEGKFIPNSNKSINNSTILLTSNRITNLKENKEYPLDTKDNESKISQDEKININDLSEYYQNNQSFNSTNCSSFIKTESQEYKAEIKDARPYQLKIFKEAKERNSIIYMETGKGKTYVAIMLINNLFYDQYRMKECNEKLKKNKKVVFLVNEVSLIEQQRKVLESNCKLKISLLKGGNSSKFKTKKHFITFWEATDILVIIPTIFIKYCAIGFLRFSEIDMLVFDECHHCDLNHNFNVIMKDFYFFHLGRKEKVPQIIGLTASPCKTKISNNVEIESLISLEKICNNLNCDVVCDDDLLELEDQEDIYISNTSSQQINTEFIEVNRLESANKELLFIVDKLLLETMNVIYKFTESSSIKEYKLDQYLNYIGMKFSSSDFADYNKILQMKMELYIKRKESLVLSVFENFQIKLFLLMENTCIESITELVQDYITNFKKISDTLKKKEGSEDYSTLIKSDFNNIYLLNEFISIFQNCFDAIKDFNYCSHRLIKLTYFLLKQYKDNPEKKTIVFVSNREVAFKLNKYFNEILTKKNYELKSVCVVGVNNKKSDFSVNTKNNHNNLNEEITKFRKGEAKILIGTNAVEEGIDVKECDTVIAFTHVRTPKSYVQMKGRARKAKANFIIFTDDRNKTESDIKNFIEFFNSMKSHFQSEMVGIFKKDEYILLKEKQISEEYYYIVEKTKAKITLNVSTQFMNEIEQELKNLKNNKIEYKCRSFKSTKEGGFDYQYEAKVSSSFFEGDISLQSNIFSNKGLAKSHIDLLIIRMLHEENIINDHFKLN